MHAAAFGQIPPTSVLVRPPTAAPASQPNKRIYKPRPNAPPVGWWDVHAVEQYNDGQVRHLRGHAEMENVNMLFRADEIDYNDDTGDVQARGNIYFEQFERNEKIWADHMEYNTKTEKGKFYDVRGTTAPRIDTRPGMLTSTNPYYFEGKWAERVEGHYILYDGFLTNCRIPNPWWRLKGPRFNVVPQESAKAYRAVFLLRKFPLFYTPFFYKSLEKRPRRSGLLMPNIGHSSTRGYMFGVGAFWAINRSYDATYHVQDYTARGYAHHLELRGKPTDKADFDAILFGVQDRGLLESNGERGPKQGGITASVAGKADLGDGWTARGFINYLSSFTFREAFSDSFNEAVFSEVNSVAFLNKDWSTYTVDAVVEHRQDFTSLEITQTDPSGKQNTQTNAVVVKKLPEVDLSSRDHPVADDLPVWYSFDSSAGLLSRSQPDFLCDSNPSSCQQVYNNDTQLLGRYQTSLLNTRMDFAPQITAALHLGDFHLVPSVKVDETFYGETQGPYEDGFLRVLPSDFLRSAREFKVDLVAPSFGRVFNRKSWLGDKVKHVIEPRATYEYVTGIGQDFNKVIRFDQTDLLSNTNQVTFSLTNRLYAKRGDDVSEIFSWELSGARYFDPTFGGAIIPGQRNVLLSQIELTPFAFLDGPRTYSPIVSALRAQPKWNIAFEWRTDYDPARHGIVASTASADWRKTLPHTDKDFFISVGQTEVHSDTTLLPSENQTRASLGIGNSTRRGWNAAFVAVYDNKVGILDFAIMQATYNTDCCGFSVQLVRYDFGTRDETQYRFAFAVANLGSFGTLKRQERLF
jgi:LPS-assembly protein